MDGFWQDGVAIETLANTMHYGNHSRYFSVLQVSQPIHLVWIGLLEQAWKVLMAFLSWSLSLVRCMKITKKSHSTLRAKRAKFTFWVDKSLLKMPKNCPFWRVFENLKVNCNRTKIDRKCQNWKIQMRLFWWSSNIVNTLNI